MPERFNEKFWAYADELVSKTQVVIDRPRDSHHPEYDDMIYPLDYGYLAGTMASDGGGIDVWVGKSGQHNIVAAIVTIDLIKRDSEIKLLLGCDEDEMRDIAQFFEDNDMGCLLVRRE